MEKQDIDTTADIKLLVDKFYGKVLKDPVLGYIFSDIARISMDEHMPVMYAFWSSMLLGTDNYRSNPMGKHIELDKKTPLLPEHFERWLAIMGREYS